MTDEIYDMTQGWNSIAAEMLYIFMQGGPPANELAFYERRIRANGGVALDQACGTGRHIFPLLARGLEVHGADISADALRFARQEVEAQGVTPVLYHQRMEECDLPQRYGTIYVANCTFQILSERQQALSTLKRFWQHLLPGGQLLLELAVHPEVTQGINIHDVDHPIRWDAERRRGQAGEIVTMLWSESVDLFEQKLVSKRRYDLYVDGQIVRSEVHAHSMRWYFKHEILMMLEKTGYEDLVTYGDFSDNPATKDSQTVVYAGRRTI
jgi:ubiquinone/menaquinone biosynthesis C-methylase UbiE